VQETETVLFKTDNKNSHITRYRSKPAISISDE